VQARLWNRIDEGHNDDNPRISDYVGRGELVMRWSPDRQNLFAFTGRHGLRSGSKGSARLEWFRTLADPGVGLPSGLRLHTQLFSGYGETLIDYNRNRTVFSIGLSLVEW
jgi:phospholipase A1/A2